jgi:aminoglycoside 3-N-acetyltransferase I
MTADLTVARLTSTSLTTARDTFALLTEVFGEPRTDPGDDWLSGLLGNESFRGYAAMYGGEVVGGLTAYLLPLTRARGTEVFLYDLAVRADFRRQGVARRLVGAVRAEFSGDAVMSVFVLADNADEHALAFYRAVGAEPAPVTMFSFGPTALD